MTREEAINYLRSSGMTEEQIDSVAVAFEQRWIPVTERLPEEYGEYMITWTTSHSMVNGKYGLLGIAEYELTGEYDAENNRFKGEWLLEEYVENYSNVKVTAWMPLPEPYMAESEDKLDGDPVDIDKAVEHYEGTLETLKGIDLGDNA